MTGSQVSLVVAALDLKRVQGVIRAMRAADVAAARTKPPCNAVEDRRVIHPTPEIAPRPVIHPTPQARVEPRRVIHLTPRQAVAPASVSGSGEEELHSRITPSPIQPPWKQLPWQEPIPTPAGVKPVIYKTEVINKGSLLNLIV